MSNLGAGWTDERVELLTKLWSEGLSASQTAKKMGGVTRNAVISKIHRLGLSGNRTTANARHRKGATRINLSDEQQTKLRSLWEADVAVPVIAKKLGMKNEQSVYYYADRLGLEKRTPKQALRVESIGEVRQKTPQVPTPVSTEPPVFTDVFGTRNAVLALTSERCKWPFGDVGTEGFHFCRRSVAVAGLSYCDEHARIAYQPAVRRQRRPSFTWRGAKSA